MCALFALVKNSARQARFESHHHIERHLGEGSAEKAGAMVTKLEAENAVSAADKVSPDLKTLAAEFVTLAKNAKVVGE